MYWKGSSYEFNNDTFTQVDKISTSEYTDGESWDYIVQRGSDKKFFIFHIWEDSNGYIFNGDGGENALLEVFPETVTVTKYV